MKLILALIVFTSSYVCAMEQRRQLMPVVNITEAPEECLGAIRNPSPIKTGYARIEPTAAPAKREPTTRSTSIVMVANTFKE